MKTTKLIALIGMLSMSAAAAFSAQSITYTFDKVLVGEVEPSGIAPWMGLNIQSLSENSVDFTLTSSLSNGEFVSGVGINLGSGFNFNPISFSNYSKLGSFNDAQVFYGNNVRSGGAGIDYDIWFEFDTSNSGGGSKRFNENDSFTFTISGVSLNDFNVNKNPVIAHTQNLENGASSWIGSGVHSGSVPEPSSILVGSMGMLILLSKRRRND